MRKFRCKENLTQLIYRVNCLQQSKEVGTAVSMVVNEAAAVCYAIIELTLIGLKQPLVTSQSQARRLDMVSQHASVDRLSQHAVAQSQAREAGHTIPACKVQPSYSSMQSPNHRPGELDMLSQHSIMQTSYPSMHSPKHRPGKLDKLSHHAVETNHKSGKSDMLAQYAQNRQAIHACIVNYAADRLTQQNSCRIRRDLHKRSNQLQHLRRLGKRHEA